jgi:hypothetical protein
MLQLFHQPSNKFRSKQPTANLSLLALVGRSLVLLLLALPISLLNHGAARADDPVAPSLSIETKTVNLMNLSTVSVPVAFASGDHDISAISFSLDFDEDCLTFDGTSVSGLPNSNGYVSTVSYDAEDTGGEIDISIRDQDETQNALADGNFTFTFGVKAGCRTTNGDTVPVAFAFDSDPSPTFGDTDGHAVAGSATGGTYTLRFNAYPSDIDLDGDSVNENASSGTTVGDFSTTDADADLSDSHTYSLVSGTGDTDNSYFAIDGATLKTNAVFNYELKSSYSIRVRSTDSYGGAFEKAFTIDIVDVNEAPISLLLDNNGVAENAAINTVVGTLSRVDPETGDSATYSLVTGAGDTDNAVFNISGSQLRTSASFNYEANNTYSVRVQVTDGGNNTLATFFIIRINDVNDAPVANDDTYDPDKQVIWDEVDLAVLTNDTDQDRGDVLSISAVGSPSAGSVVTTTSTLLRYTPANSNGVVTFTYTTRDSGLLTDTATVTVTTVRNDPRGDCNGDSSVNAGDFSAIALELFDSTNDSSNWYHAYTGSFAGSPKGCDANANKNIEIGDLICTVLVSFGKTACTLGGFADIMAAQTPVEAALAVASGLEGLRNSPVEAPILLETNGHRVSAASFALSFDKSQLTFDATDADENGVPDAVSIETPPGMVAMVNYDEEASRLEVTVYGVMMPLPMLSDGVLATISFQVNEAAITEAPLNLVLGSLGNDQGQSVPVRLDSGSVMIAQQSHRFYLPMLYR